MPRDFWTSFNGWFSGVLDWSDVETLFSSLRKNSKGWYLAEMQSSDESNPASVPDMPESVLDEDDFLKFLVEAESVINKRRSRPYCGAIYVDNKDDPAFIKIFDPTKMGSSCSCSTEPVLPRWTISRIKPEPLPQKPQKSPNPGFFARLTGIGS